MQHYLKDGQVFGFENKGERRVISAYVPGTPAAPAVLASEGFEGSPAVPAVPAVPEVIEVITPEQQHQARLADGYAAMTIEEARAFTAPPPVVIPAIEKIRNLERVPTVRDAMERVARQDFLKRALEAGALKAPSYTQAQVLAFCISSVPDFKTLWDTEQAVKLLRTQL